MKIEWHINTLAIVRGHLTQEYAVKLGECNSSICLSHKVLAQRSNIYIN